MKKSVQLLVVEPHAEIVNPFEEYFNMKVYMDCYLKHIEKCGRVSHKSEKRAKDGSAIPFIKKIAINYGHQSIIEHSLLTVCFVGSRTMSHQLVRHRIGSFTQESQRYCDYSKNKNGETRLNIIIPPSIGNIIPGAVITFSPEYHIEIQHPVEAGIDVLMKESSPLYVFLTNALSSYENYLILRDKGTPAEDAREVLPNCTKTEVYTSFNFREWLHFFKMRMDSHAQWQIKKLATTVFNFFKENCPLLLEKLLDHSGNELK